MPVSSSGLKRREFDIDFFRGWVCISLMCLHFFNNFLYDSFFALFGETGKYLIWNWRLGVESFFVLAGFMMAHMLRPVAGEDVSLVGYVKKRFFRLILPYWVAVSIFTAYRWGARWFLHAATAPPSLVDVVAQMFLLQEFFVAPEQLERVIPVGYWSMVALEQFYLLWLAFYSIALRIFRWDRGRGYGRAEHAMFHMTFAVFAGSLAFWVCRDGHITGTPLGWHMTEGQFTALVNGNGVPVQLPLYAAFLALGMLLYWAIRHRIFRPYFCVAMALLLAAAIDTNYSRLWKSLFAAVFFIPLAHGVRLPNCAVLRFLSYCGKRSYSIYLVHGIAGIAFLSLTWRITAIGAWLAIPLGLAAIGVSILAANVFYRYIELPCQERSRHVEYRKKRVVNEDSVERNAEVAAV